MTETLDQELAEVDRDIADVNAHLDTYYASHRIPSGRYIVDYEHQLTRLYGRRLELALRRMAAQEVTRHATTV